MKYDEPGEYEITLSAEDNCGNRATATRQITVEEPQPSSAIVDEDFTAIPHNDGEHKLMLTQLQNVEVGDHINITVSNPVISTIIGDFVGDSDLVVNSDIYQADTTLISWAAVSSSIFPTTPL